MAKAAARRPWQLRHTTGCSRKALHGARNRATASLADRIWLFRTACLSAPRRTSFAVSVPRMVVQLVESLRISRRGEKNEKEKKSRARAKRRGVHGAEDGRAVAGAIRDVGLDVTANAHRHIPAVRSAESRRDPTRAVRDVGGLYAPVVTQRLFQQSAVDTVGLHAKKVMDEVGAAWVAAGAKLASKTARVQWEIPRCS